MKKASQNNYVVPLCSIRESTRLPYCCCHGNCEPIARSSWLSADRRYFGTLLLAGVASSRVRLKLLLFACADDVRHFSFYRAKFIVNSVTQFSLQKLLVVEIKSSFVSYLLKVNFCVKQDLLALKLTPISKMSKPWAFYFLDSGRTQFEYLTSGGYVCNMS